MRGLCNNLLVCLIVKAKVLETRRTKDVVFVISLFVVWPKKVEKNILWLPIQRMIYRHFRHFIFCNLMQGRVNIYFGLRKWQISFFAAI